MRAFLLLLAMAAPAGAGEVRVAVAANFQGTFARLEALFEAASGHEVIASTGSTGGLYAQIAQGAPFDLFLSADAARPALLAGEGRAPATYALGRLVLFSAIHEAADEDTLAGPLGTLAHADPELAPYGAAAAEVLEATGAAPERLLTAENVGQAATFALTGNADWALIPAPMAIGREGAAWPVPTELHAPIAQDMVVTPRGAGNAAAAELFAFLLSPEARAVIEADGYALP